MWPWHISKTQRHAVFIYEAWLDETLLSHKKDEIKKWTEGKYKDLQIFGNRTLEFTK